MIAHPKLAAGWPLEEADGARYDIASGIALGVGNNVTSAVGKFGNCASFDGTDDYLESATGVPSITGALTIAAWIKPSTVAAGAHAVACRWPGDTGNTRSWVLYLNGAVLSMLVNPTGLSTGNISAAGSSLGTTEWRHVAGVYVPSTSVTLYLDGVQDGQTTASVPAALYNNVYFALGAAHAPAGTVLDYGGLIDEVQLWTVALGARDIGRIMLGLAPLEV